MKRNFFKISAAALLALAGISTAATAKTALAANYTTPLKRVAVNYLPGKELKVWTGYGKERSIAFKAKNNSKWNVAETAVDKKGKLWYKVGINEWLEARYTVEIKNKNSSSAPEEQAAKTNEKIKLSKVGQKQKPKKKTGSKNDSLTQSVSADNKATANSNASTAVVNLAKAQVGKAYAWGANGPDSFDCSSLVQYVYNKAAGITLPRVTYDQVKVGTTVSMNQLKPGDLLFWGSTDAPYHVAIYIGNNQYVNAATPDQGVILQTISSYYYPCLAKRVL